MKKISVILSAVALVIVGCTKEQSTSLLNTTEGNNVVSFKATFEGETPDTKLGINTTSGALTWADGDAIAVQMTDDTFIEFIYSSSTQEFTASLGEKKVKDGGVAYYPSTIAINETPGSVQLPDEYTARVSEGIATVCPPMKATVNLGAETLNLKHLGGILSIRVSYVPADATKLVLNVLAKNLTGNFVVTDGEDDFISAKSDGSSTINVNFNAGDFGTSATEFFIPVPVTTFEGGFTVEFQNESKETLYTHSTSKATITAARASITRMAELTVPSYIYISENTDDSWENVKVYAKNSSVQFTNNWPGNVLSGNTFTHNGHSYKRIEIPAAQLGVSGGEITVSGTAVGSTGDGTRDYVRVGLYNQTFNSDVYYYVSTTSPSAYKLYMEDQTGDYNLHLHIFGTTNTPSTSWPGVTVGGLNSESLDNGLSTKYYIQTTSGNNFQFTVNNNGSDANKSDQNISADKNYIYYMTIWKAGESNWWYSYSFTPCSITQE